MTGKVSITVAFSNSSALLNNWKPSCVVLLASMVVGANFLLARNCCAQAPLEVESTAKAMLACASQRRDVGFKNKGRGRPCCWGWVHVTLSLSGVIFHCKKSRFAMLVEK